MPPLCDHLCSHVCKLDNVLCGNVLIPEDKKNFQLWYAATYFFFFFFFLSFQFCCFPQKNHSLGLGFRFGLSVDPVLHHLAPQRLSLNIQSIIQFLGPLSGRRNVLA